MKPNTHSVYIPAYQFPHSQMQIVDQQFKEMLDQGIIQHSRLPSFPCPEKKCGYYRPFIDFRKVNEVTEDDRYPLPILSDLLCS